MNGSITRRPICPAVVAAVRRRSPDALMEELSHRRRAHEGFEGLDRKPAILIVAAFDADDHLVLRPVVADALDDGAAVDVAALERPKIDRAAVSTVSAPIGAVSTRRIRFVAARIMSPLAPDLPPFEHACRRRFYLASPQSGHPGFPARKSFSNQRDKAG